MSAYNLKQHLNEWTNIEVSIDNNTGTVDLFINGTQQQFAAGVNTIAGTGGSKSLTISGGKQFTKNTNSKCYVGGNQDNQKRFTGKMERIEFSNKARSASSALAKYKQLKKREGNSMMNMKFKPSSSRELGESSKYNTKAKFNKQSGGATLEVNDGRNAVKFNSGDYIEMETTSALYGNQLLNSTFTSWVKLPPTSSGYEPIISRENVFSFGINNGHASLFLSQNNQLAPGTNVSKESSSTVTTGQAISSVMESTHENLLVDANFNTTNTKITKTGGTTEYSSIIPGSKAVKLTTSDKIEVDRTALIGKNMNKFTFSGWVNLSSLNDNAILFERPDAGLKLSTNASGQVSLDFNTVVISNTVWYVDIYPSHIAHSAYPTSGITSSRFTECTLVDSSKNTIPTLTTEGTKAYSDEWTYTNAPTMYSIYNNGNSSSVNTVMTNGKTKYSSSGFVEQTGQTTLYTSETQGNYFVEGNHEGTAFYRYKYVFSEPVKPDYFALGNTDGGPYDHHIVKIYMGEDMQLVQTLADNSVAGTEAYKIYWKELQY